MENPLITVDGKEDLAEIQRERYEHALRAVVTGKTDQADFPGGRIPIRPIRGSREAPYIPGYWFIKNANALFGYYWDHKITEFRIDDKLDQVLSLNQITVKIPGKTVTETKPDGTVVETRFDPVEITKMQFGGSDIKRYTQGEKQGRVMDLADDLKASGTDGMKKCLVEFGFGADVYGDREMIEVATESERQAQTHLAALYVAGEKRGMSKNKVDEFSSEAMGKKPEDLMPAAVLTLLGEIRSLKDVTK